MRLLEACDGPGGLEFRLTKDLDDASIPLYAILSHTWGPDSEEVSYQDMSDGAGMAKAGTPGYDKIRFCGRQARRDGLTHFWIDTCCIDKSNNAELAEALNSMFRWYQRATRCYVFLPDVASAADPEAWTPSFRASRWFTRGWTLQELIAPSTVQFFAKDSSLLGDRHSLLSLIAEITGIAEAALTGDPLDNFSTEERFSWAKNRQTKREEDWAYSLLGIFGVFIPPIYGERRASAEQRLKEAIKVKATAGKQLETQQAHFVVPYLSNDDFVKRPGPFEKLKTRLGYGSKRTDGTSQSRVSLFGLGGVGKTQISIAFVYWLRQAHPGVSVFWVHASTAEHFQQAYTSFAQQMRISDVGPGQHKLDLVKLWLERKDVGRWLLVIDNADDKQVFFSPKDTPKDNTSKRDKPLASYIPECSHVSVLITTRNKQTGLRLTHQRRPIEVGKMDDTESQQLLSKKLDDTTSKNRQRLSTRLESLPLALAQAAAFIQRNSISISEYIELLDESPAEVLDTEFEAPGRDEEIPRAVMQTWKISFEQIKRDNPLAGDLLSFMGLVDRQAIPREFLTSYVELFYPEPQSTRSIRLVTALGVLKAYSFVTGNESSGLEMHRLVHLSTQRWLEGKEDLSRFSGQALQTLSKILPDDRKALARTRSRDMYSLYLPHIYAVLKHRSADSKPGKVWRASLLYYAAGSPAGTHHEYANARTFAEESLALRKSVLGDKDERTLQSIRQLRWISAAENYLKAYLRYLQGVYELHTAYGAESHWTLLHLMSEMAVVHTIQDRHEQAEELRIRISETARKMKGSEMDPTALVSMSDLAAAYLGKGMLEKAKDLQMQVLQLQEERGLGEDHPEAIRGIDLLSRIKGAQERGEEALPFVLTASEVDKRYDVVKQSMARYRLEVEVGHGFEDAWRMEIEEATTRWGEDDPRTLECIGTIATQYFDAQLYTESLKLWEEVFSRMAKMPGHHHRETLGRAALQLQQHVESDQDEEALDLGLKLFEVSSTVLGEDDPDTLATIATISSIYFEAKRYKECLEWALKDLEGRSKLFGEDHPAIPELISRLARIHLGLRRDKEAVAWGETWVASSKRVLGPDDVKTVRAISGLASLYRFPDVGRYEEALLLIQQVLEAAERTLGPDDEFTISTRVEFDEWSREAETARATKTSSATMPQDQKDVQRTPPGKTEESQVAASKDSNDVEEPRPTPPVSGTEPSAAPKAEPGEEKDQHNPTVANAAIKADTAPSPDTQGLENQQPPPSSGKTKDEPTEPAPVAPDIENKQTPPTAETTGGTPANNKVGAADTAASSRPRQRFRDSFKISSWSRKRKE